MIRYNEKKLIAPFLFLVKNNPEIKMESIIPIIEGVLKPEGKDAEIVPGRNDTYFSQKVRNLRSHREQNKMNKYTKLDTNGGYTITDEGLKVLDDDYAAMEALFSFKNIDNVEKERLITTRLFNKNKKVTVFQEDDVVSEGTKRVRNVTVLERSKKLRAYAVQLQQDKHDFKCSICGFDFEKKYGDIGANFIQFHHIKPLSEYEDNQMTDIQLKEAIKNIIPICPNCHCMIHKIKAVDTISELKSKINGGNN